MVLFRAFFYVLVINIILYFISVECFCFEKKKNPTKDDLFTCPFWLGNERGSSPDALVRRVNRRARWRRRGAGEGRGPSPCKNLYSYVSE